MIFIAVATILSSFCLAPATDEHGNADVYEVEYTSGAFRYSRFAVAVNAITDLVASHPGPFKCSIRPRNPEIEAVIRSS